MTFSLKLIYNLDVRSRNFKTLSGGYDFHGCLQESANAECATKEFRKVETSEKIGRWKKEGASE